jgi:hypothetical protein
LLNKSVPIITQRDVAEQLRYHYLCHREIDRTIKALERFQRLRETETPAVKAFRRRAGRAA